MSSDGAEREPRGSHSPLTTGAEPSGMVERVARALCSFLGLDPDEIIPGGVPCWTWHTEQARAAIEAMREPTAAMVEDGDCHNRAEGSTIECFENVRTIYRAMIDAALKEGA